MTKHSAPFLPIEYWEREKRENTAKANRARAEGNTRLAKIYQDRADGYAKSLERVERKSDKRKKEKKSGIRGIVPFGKSPRGFIEKNF